VAEGARLVPTTDDRRLTTDDRRLTTAD